MRGKLNKQIILYLNLRVTPPKLTSLGLFFSFSNSDSLACVKMTFQIVLVCPNFYLDFFRKFLVCGACCWCAI